MKKALASSLLFWGAASAFAGLPDGVILGVTSADKLPQSPALEKVTPQSGNVVYMHRFAPEEGGSLEGIAYLMCQNGNTVCTYVEDLKDLLTVGEPGEEPNSGNSYIDVKKKVTEGRRYMGSAVPFPCALGALNDEFYEGDGGTVVEWISDSAMTKPFILYRASEAFADHQAEVQKMCDGLGGDPMMAYGFLMGRGHNVDGFARKYTEPMDVLIKRQDADVSDLGNGTTVIKTKPARHVFPYPFDAQYSVSFTFTDNAALARVEAEIPGADAAKACDAHPATIYEPIVSDGAACAFKHGKATVEIKKKDGAIAIVYALTDEALKDASTAGAQKDVLLDSLRDKVDTENGVAK